MKRIEKFVDRVVNYWSPIFNRAGRYVRTSLTGLQPYIKKQAQTFFAAVGKNIRENLVKLIGSTVLLFVFSFVLVFLYHRGVDPRDWLESLKNPPVAHTVAGCVEDLETGMAVGGMRIGVEGYAVQAKTNAAGEYELQFDARPSEEKIFVNIIGNGVYEEERKGKTYPASREALILDFQLKRVRDVVATSQR